MRKLLFTALITSIAGLCLAGPGLAEDAASSAATQSEAESAEATPFLQEVDAVKVCMVNDQLFAKDQIPVEVEGKTYFGCCDMCKARLANDAAIRSATDPLTGESVDKAAAIKAADAEGAIYYFASAENLEKYLSEKSQPAETKSE